MTNDTEAPTPHGAPAVADTPSDYEQDAVVVPENNEPSLEAKGYATVASGNGKQGVGEKESRTSHKESSEASLSRSLPLRASGFANLLSSFRKAAPTSNSEEIADTQPASKPSNESSKDPPPVCDNVSLATSPAEYPSMAPVEEVYMTSDPPVISSVGGDTTSSPSNQTSVPEDRGDLSGSVFSLKASDAGSVMSEDLFAAMEEPALQEEIQEATDSLQPPRIFQDYQHSRSSSEAEDTSVIRKTLERAMPTATDPAEEQAKADPATMVAATSEEIAIPVEEEARAGEEFGFDAFMMIGKNLLRREEEQPAVSNNERSNHKKLVRRIATGAGGLILFLIVALCMRSNQSAPASKAIAQDDANVEPMVAIQEEVIEPADADVDAGAASVGDISDHSRMDLFDQLRTLIHFHNTTTAEDTNETAFAYSTGEDETDTVYTKSTGESILPPKVPEPESVLDLNSASGCSSGTYEYFEPIACRFNTWYNSLEIPSLFSKKPSMLLEEPSAFCKSWYFFLEKQPTFCKALLVLVVALSTAMVGAIFMLFTLSPSKTSQKEVNNPVSKAVKKEEKHTIPPGEDTEPLLVDLSGYRLLRKEDLADILRKRELPVSGKKEELIHRLVKDYRDEFEPLPYRKIQKRLKRHGLRQTGKKEELVVRLIEAGSKKKMRA